MQARLAVPILVLLSVLHSNVTLAQWQLDGTVISSALSDQRNPAIASDGAGGAIVAWSDYRGSNYDIYAQRISASGAVMWTTDGVAVCATAGSQIFAGIAADGAGGAIVTWQDYRGTNYDIYAQRLNASGVAQWAANGIALCSAARDQESPTIIPDGAGGAFIAWSDYRASNYDIYAQRINAAGAAMWTVNGLVLCNQASQQGSPVMVSDGASGVIVIWQDSRSGQSDIYSQRVNLNGATMWSPNGLVLSGVAGDQVSPAVVTDGAGGAIVAWLDYRGVDPDIYAQRVTNAGTKLWATDGTGVCIATGEQVLPVLVSDGAGGAIITWYDRRSGPEYDIYAQRMNPSAAALWPVDGVALCTAAGDQTAPAIVTDGAGGAIVTWYDRRSTTDSNAYAQRINALGTVQWTPNGMAVCTAARDYYSAAFVSDGVGGAILTWQDYRNLAGVTDIYAQRVEGRYGDWGHPEPMVTTVADIRNDQGGKVKVNWLASGRDVLNQQVITHYSLWRGSDVAPSSSAMAADILVTDPSRVTSDYSGKAVWKQRAATTDYYWEWVGNQNAIYQRAYTFSASTRADSTIGGPATEHFMVLAHTVNQFTFWPSNEMSGHSVDNLAPGAPLYLTAQRVGADVHLRWNRVRVSDLRDYSVYRATSSGVTPVPVNFLSSANDTVLVDGNSPTSSLYYIVTAYDVHANQSAPSNEAAVSPSTGAGDTPAIGVLTVLQNRPNPFAGSTEFEIGLPEASDVAIEIYDVAGRRVRAQSLPQQGAGWQKVSFNGRDDAGRALASGVYFCRVSANGIAVTRKIVITR